MRMSAHMRQNDRYVVCVVSLLFSLMIFLSLLSCCSLLLLFCFVFVCFGNTCGFVVAVCFFLFVVRIEFFCLYCRV